MASQTLALTAPPSLVTPTMRLFADADGSVADGSPFTLTESGTEPGYYTNTTTGTLAGLFRAYLYSGAVQVASGWVSLANADGVYTVQNTRVEAVLYAKMPSTTFLAGSNNAATDLAVVNNNAATANTNALAAKNNTEGLQLLLNVPDLGDATFTPAVNAAIAAATDVELSGTHGAGAWTGGGYTSGVRVVVVSPLSEDAEDLTIVPGDDYGSTTGDPVQFNVSGVPDPTAATCWLGIGPKDGDSILHVSGVIATVSSGVYSLTFTLTGTQTAALSADETYGFSVQINYGSSERTVVLGTCLTKRKWD